MKSDHDEVELEGPQSENDKSLLQKDKEEKEEIWVNNVK